MAEHKHEWRIVIGRSFADCNVEDCHEKLTWDEIERRLNAKPIVYIVSKWVKEMIDELNVT